MLKWFMGAVITAICMQWATGAEKFSCDGRASGYYADVETGCQIYHMCDGLGRQFSYHCPNTTLFQQRMLICDHWYMVNCSKSEHDYSANLLIGQRDKPFVEDSQEHPYHRTPRPDLLNEPYAPRYRDHDHREGRAQSISKKNLVGVATDEEEGSKNSSTDRPQYFLPSHWSTQYGKVYTTPLPVKKLQKPLPSLSKNPVRTSVKGNSFDTKYYKVTKPFVQVSAKQDILERDTENAASVSPSTLALPPFAPGEATSRPSFTLDGVPPRTDFAAINSRTSTERNTKVVAPSRSILAPIDTTFVEKLKYTNVASRPNVASRTPEENFRNAVLSRTASTPVQESIEGKRDNFEASRPKNPTGPNSRSPQIKTTEAPSIVIVPTPIKEKTKEEVVSRPVLAPINSTNFERKVFEVTKPIATRTEDNIDLPAAPSIYYQPPKLLASFDAESTTMDPQTFYNLVPSKDLQPPVLRNYSNNRNINKLTTTTTTTTQKSVSKKDIETERPTDKIMTDRRWKELRQMFFIPEYDFPLEIGSRPSYESGLSSFQVNSAPASPEMRFREVNGSGPNSDCPKCDPKFVVAGTCKPCVMIRR